MSSSDSRPRDLSPYRNDGATVQRKHPWIRYLRLRLETNGFVTSGDFKALGISAGSTWIDRWIEWDGTKLGRHHRYVAIASPLDPRPDMLHPEVTAALRVSGEF